MKLHHPFWRLAFGFLSPEGTFLGQPRAQPSLLYTSPNSCTAKPFNIKARGKRHERQRVECRPGVTHPPMIFPRAACWRLSPPARGTGRGFPRSQPGVAAWLAGSSQALPRAKLFCPFRAFPPATSGLRGPRVIEHLKNQLVYNNEGERPRPPQNSPIASTWWTLPVAVRYRTTTFSVTGPSIPPVSPMLSVVADALGPASWARMI